jgi:hypothetical protein
MSQRDVSLAGDADARVNRNPGGTVSAGEGDLVLEALAQLDVGFGPGLRREAESYALASATAPCFRHCPPVIRLGCAS